MRSKIEAKFPTPSPPVKTQGKEGRMREMS